MAEWCNMFHLLLLNTNNLVIGQHECIKEWLKDESAWLTLTICCWLWPVAVVCETWRGNWTISAGWDILELAIVLEQDWLAVVALETVSWPECTRVTLAPSGGFCPLIATVLGMLTCTTAIPLSTTWLFHCVCEEVTNWCKWDRACAAWWYHPISKAISCHIDSVIWASRELSALFARFPENTVLAIGLLCVWVEVPCPFKWVTEVNGD